MLKCNSILFGTMIAVFMGNGLTGCVTMTPEQQAQLQRDAAIQITCTKGDDCEEKWSRAVAWISQNSSYKIQTQTDSLIQTFNPTGSSPSSGFLVNKFALGKGIYQITMSSACNNAFGCIPDAQELRASFNRFVAGAATMIAQSPSNTSAQPIDNDLAEIQQLLKSVGEKPDTSGIERDLNAIQTGGASPAIIADVRRARLEMMKQRLVELQNAGNDQTKIAQWKNKYQEQPKSGKKLGIAMWPVTAEMAKVLNMTELRGLVTLKVEKESVAERGGIVPDDVLLRYNDTVLTTPQDLINAIQETQSGSAIRMLIWRKGGETTISLSF